MGYESSKLKFIMNKKLLSILTLAATFSVAHAQEKVTFIESNPIVKELNNPTDNPTESYKKGEQKEFDQYYQRRTGLMVDEVIVTINTSAGSQKVKFNPTGTNYLYWKEIGVYFPFSGKASVIGVRAIIDEYKAKESGDNYEIALYNADVNTKLPKEPLAYEPFTGDIVTTGTEVDSFLYIKFASNQFTDITSSFVTSIALEEVTPFKDASDSIVVYSNMKGDGNGESRTVVKITNESVLATEGQVDDVWYQLDKVFKDENGDFVSFDYDLMLIPILDVDYMSGDYVNLEGMKFNGVYPNPSVNQATLNFSLNRSFDNVRVAVQTLSGKTLQVINTGSLSEGNQSVNVNTSELPAGSYIYTITTDNVNFSGALQVVK